MSDPAENSRPAAPSSNPAGAIARHGYGQGHDRALGLGHESQIAQPSTFLLPRGNTPAMPEPPLTQVDRDQQQGLVSAPKLLLRRVIRPARGDGGSSHRGLRNFTNVARLTRILPLQRSMRDFLKKRTSYDVLPLSFRLIILNTDLLVKKSLNILLQNGPSPLLPLTDNIASAILVLTSSPGIVSAPLWDSHTSTFAGILTTSDYINVVQYYWQNPDAFSQVDQFRLSSLREIEKAINVLPLETISVHPMRPLYEACRQMLKTRARRIPLVDIDDETGREMVVSVITQYRILKFIAVNVEATELLRKSVAEIGLGTYHDLQTANIDTPVIDVIHTMVKYNISSVPIVDADNRVLNVFEAVDVIAIIKGGVYEELTTSVGNALLKRAEDFAGIYTCSEEDRLDSIFDTIRKSRVHRLVVIDDENRLRGMISLSDILKYVILHDEDDD